MTDTTELIRFAIELKKLMGGTFTTPSPPTPPADEGDEGRVDVHLRTIGDVNPDPSAGPMPAPVLLQFTGTAGSPGIASLRTQLERALAQIDKGEPGSWLVVSLGFTPGDPPAGH